MSAAVANRRLAGGFLVAALVLAGCPKPPVVVEPEPECTDLKPCSGGLICREAACLPCRIDNDCAIVEICNPIEKRCALRTCFGTACGVHDDCSLGEFCVQGLCLRSDATHELGCTVVSCADGEECAEGQRCHPVNFVCEEDIGCQGDVDCGTGQRCNVPASRCEAACTAEDAAEVCGITRACHAGICVDCTQDSDCGGGLRCNTDKNLCEGELTCDSNRDCELPLLCNRLTKQCTTSVPPCTSADDCAADETCQLSTGRCVGAFCSPDAKEPNEEIAQAVPIFPGRTSGLTLCAGDVDYFRIALARGDRLQASVERDPLLPFEIALVSATGEVLDQGEFVADGTVSVAGDYFVRTRSSDQFVRYSLLLNDSRGVPCDDDVEEPNDGFVDATASAAGELYQQTICPGDEDWYVVAVETTQRFEAELASNPADGDLDVTLYDGNLRELARSPASPAEAEEVSSSSFRTTRLYVKVAGAGPGVQNVYDLRIRLRPR